MIAPAVQPSAVPISIVIPVYNGGEQFRHCLASIQQFAPPEVEVIVVADADQDGSWQVALQFGAKVLRLPQNSGPARARNLGALIARGELLFFIDADVAIAANTIQQVVQLFREEPQLAAAIGSYDDAPASPNFLSQYKNLFHHYTHQTASEEASTFWGACGAIRREVFLSTGGFNSAYRYPSIEDIELGYRLKAAGHPIKLVKTLQVKHLKCWTVTSLLQADFFYRALPWTELILRDRHLPNDLNLKLASRFSVVLVYSLGLVPFLLGSPSLLAFLVMPVLILLIFLNMDVYHFFYRRRGLAFTLQVIPWHWAYYFYSGLAFAVGLIRYCLYPQK
uniref:4,4'-diaponeurosporenoate glycosyltransferase n=1 Tax=Cyanothece sp. (strain PCC 7425 / ATCC 29141) TaxID=395961 RepID=B8HK24_CYAP4